MTLGTLFYDSTISQISGRFFKTEVTLDKTLEQQVREVSQLKELVSSLNGKEAEITNVNQRVNKIEEKLGDIGKKIDEKKTNEETGKINERLGKIGEKLEGMVKKIDEYRNNAETVKTKDRLDKLEKSLVKIIEDKNKAFASKPKDPSKST